MTGQELINEVSVTFQVIHSRSTKEELVILCPEPGCADSSGNRSINVKTGKTNCWRCNKGGDFVRWAKGLGYEVQEGESSAVTMDQLEEMESEVEASPRLRSGFIREVKLPSGFIRIADEPDSAYARLIERMAIKKRLSFDDFATAGVGFTRDSVVWEPFAIFPVIDRGLVVYYQGRTYVDIPGESTKKFPSRSEISLGASNWVYNIDTLRAKRAKTVIVVESILNVMSLQKELDRHEVDWAVPVAVFKHAVSRPQEQKIMSVSSVIEICLMFDSDFAESSKKLANRFMNQRQFSVAVIPPREDGGIQDANDNALLAYQQFAQRQFYSTTLDTLDANLE